VLTNPGEVYEAHSIPARSVICVVWRSVTLGEVIPESRWHSEAFCR